LTGIWGAALTTIPLYDALLLSVSKTKKNFSASIGVTSLVSASPFSPDWIAANLSYDDGVIDFADWS
jgi:hypothetical protein